MEALYSPAPVNGPELSVRPVGDADKARVRHYLYGDVLAELVKAARYRREIAVALLLGQFCVDEQGPFLEITAFQDLEYHYGDDVDLVASMMPAVKAAYDPQNNEGGHHMAGVFVSFPDEEAQLNEETARLMLSLFNMPFQVAMVVDGVNDRLGLYGRDPGKPFANLPFFFVGPPDKDPVQDLPQDAAPSDIADDETNGGHENGEERPAVVDAN